MQMTIVKLSRARLHRGEELVEGRVELVEGQLLRE